MQIEFLEEKERQDMLFTKKRNGGRKTPKIIRWAKKIGIKNEKTAYTVIISVSLALLLSSLYFWAKILGIAE